MDMARVALICGRLLDSYAGYFGGLTCLAWSPDGKYVVVRSSLFQKTATHALSDRRPRRLDHNHLSTGEPSRGARARTRKLCHWHRIRPSAVQREDLSLRVRR